MEKSKKTKLILFLALISFFTLFGAGFTFACGGGEGGGGATTTTESESSISVTFADPAANADIQALEDALAASIEAGHQAQADLDNAQFWADYAINLDDVFSFATMPTNLTFAFPVSWVYQGVRRGMSAGYGSYHGNHRVVEDANKRTAMNRIKNALIEAHEEAKIRAAVESGDYVI